MPVTGVVVHDAFGDHAVDDALRFAQRFGGAVLVAGGDRLDDVLHRGADFGAQAHVVRAQADRLVGALARGFDIGHER